MSESTSFTFASSDHSLLFPDARFRGNFRTCLACALQNDICPEEMRECNGHANHPKYPRYIVSPAARMGLDPNGEPQYAGPLGVELDPFGSPKVKNVSILDTDLSEFFISTAPVFGRSLNMWHSFWPTLPLTGRRSETYLATKNGRKRKRGCALQHIPTIHMFFSQS